MHSFHKINNNIYHYSKYALPLHNNNKNDTTSTPLPKGWH